MRLFYHQDFKMVNFLELYKMLQTVASYGFKTLVDACVIVGQLLLHMQVVGNLSHSPLAKILILAPVS